MSLGLGLGLGFKGKGHLWCVKFHILSESEKNTSDPKRIYLYAKISILYGIIVYMTQQKNIEKFPQSLDRCLWNDVFLELFRLYFCMR